LLCNINLLNSIAYLRNYFSFSSSITSCCHLAFRCRY